MFKKVLLAFLLVSASSGSYAFEVKGITLGKPLPEIGVGELSKLKCSATCSGEVSFAGYKTFIHVSIDSEKIVQQITLMPDAKNFSEIKDLMIKKYGKYTDIKRSTITTKAGVEYPQENMIWKSKNGNTISFIRFVSDIDTSAILFRTKKDVENGETDLKNEKQKKLSDM